MVSVGRASRRKNLAAFEKLKKERKKTDNPREGWEDGTPPPNRDFTTHPTRV